MSGIRRYHGYVSSDEPIELGRVFFIGSKRIVFREEFTRQAWDTERRLPSAVNGQVMRGSVVAGTTGPGESPDFNNSPAPPPEHSFFYGVNYL